MPATVQSLVGKNAVGSSFDRSKAPSDLQDQSLRQPYPGRVLRRVKQFTRGRNARRRAPRAARAWCPSVTSELPRTRRAQAWRLPESAESAGNWDDRTPRCCNRKASCQIRSGAPASDGWARSLSGDRSGTPAATADGGMNASSLALSNAVWSVPGAVRDGARFGPPMQVVDQACPAARGTRRRLTLVASRATSARTDWRG
jgi:hypothetical protein